MGTPEFAVPSLERIVNAGYEVAAVITAPDKPAGRGLQMNQSALKKFALSKGLNVLQPEKLKDPKFLEDLKSLNADLQIVVAFRMLPEVVWNMPPLGTINLHASLLPQYRGAAPINWAIINGEKETGVTTFKLKHEIDTGNILMQQKIKIGDLETAGELHDRMMNMGADLVLKTIYGLTEGSLKETKQNENAGKSLHLAPKIFTETCEIKWHKNAEEIYNLIRGLSPYPCAFTYLKERKLKVFRAEKKIEATDSLPGTLITDHHSIFKFACKNGYIIPTELQLEGKKKMTIDNFLRGFRNA
jgi:methionyl-tRNA formyltransferase